MLRATLLALLLAGTATVSATAQSDDDDRPKAADKHVPAAEPSKSEDQDDDDDRAAPATAIVVTAHRLDAARMTIDQGLGATVYDLNNDTIENRPGGETGTIGSILTQTPGVSLSSSGIQIRGSKAIQVRINGAIIPEAISDPEDRLSSRFAETTTLITGSLPAQFGSAPGGVIAVTTKNGLYQHGGQGELFAGNHGAFEPAFEWGGSTNSSSLFASGSLESGRARVADSGGASASDVRHEVGGLAFADHVIDPENRVSLILGGSTERDRIGKTDLPPGVERSSSGFAVATLQHSAGKLTVQASVFDGKSDESVDFVQSQHERTGSVGTQIDSSLDTSAANTVRAGLLFTRSTSHEWGKPITAERAQRSSLGVYAADEWKPDSRVTLNVGVRADWLRNLGSAAAIEPRASMVWEPSGGFSAHAGYARYASAPPLGEERLPLPNERDDYLDAGVRQKIGPLTLGADAYARWARNLITGRDIPGEAIASAFEFGRGRFRGVDVSATYEHGPVSAWANLSVSRSLGKDIAGGASLFPAATLAAASEHWVHLASDRPLTVSAGISWRIGKLNLSGDLLAGSGGVSTADSSLPNGSRLPAFATLGLAAVYHLSLFNQPLDLRADLTNLTNAHYATSDPTNLEGGWTRFAEGRSILIGFEQGF